MSKRAKRLEKYLSQLGWDTGYGEQMQPCGHCGKKLHDYGAKFCSDCGTKLGKPKRDTSVIQTLESAIAHALEEK